MPLLSVGTVMKDKPVGRAKGGKTKGNQLGPRPKYEEIARRAYELYERRGGEPGREQEDWLQAENELRQERARPSQRTRSLATSSPPGNGAA